MDNKTAKFINYIIAFLILLFLCGYSRYQWDRSNDFGYAFSCGISFTAGALFLRDCIKMLFSTFKSKDKEQKGKKSKKLLEKLKNFFKGE